MKMGWRRCIIFVSIHCIMVHEGFELFRKVTWILLLLLKLRKLENI